MKFRSKLLVGLATAAALCASAAQAAITFDSVDFSFPDTAPAGWNVVLTYDGPGSFFTESGTTSQIAMGDDVGHAAPRHDNTNYAYVSTGQSYILDGPIISGFSVFLGSIDAHNNIGFYNGDTLIQSFGGNILAPGASGDRMNDRDNRRFFFYMNGAPVNRVVFSAGGDSMEWDTIAITTSAVPEPATWAMMITGFGLMGAALRRRRQLSAVAA